jgi:hypothetical protein
MNQANRIRERNRVGIAEDLVKNDVYRNISSLVGHLSKEYPDEWLALCDVLGEDILQHWAVSETLGERLKEKGEAVIEYLDIVIWGRATFGQLICMDSVIEDIARDML